MLGLNNALTSNVSNSGAYVNKYSVDFDGSNDFLSVADDNSLDFTAGFSVSFWVYPDAADSNDRMVAKGTTGTGEWMISFGGSSAIRVYTKDDEGNVLDFTSTNTLSTGAWAMVTVVINRTADKIQVYKNGGNLNQSSAASWAAGWANSQALRIGLNSSGSNEFEGQISEVAIWNTELKAAEVTSLYGNGAPSFNLNYNSGSYDSSSDLVGYWRMGDGVNDAHPTIYDQSSNTNNATMTNMDVEDIVLSAP